MQPPKEYTFEGNLAYSQGHSETNQVTDVLLQEIPGARAVIKSSAKEDRNGIDFWVDLGNRKIAVDAKVRREDYFHRHGKDDLALETFSVIEASKIGWTRDPSKQCDYILWMWTETGRWCLIAFPQLCSVMQRHWERWSALYGTHRQATLNGGAVRYHSECIFVPRREIWAEIYRTFSGQPNHIRPWECPGAGSTRAQSRKPQGPTGHGDMMSTVT